MADNSVQDQEKQLRHGDQDFTGSNGANGAWSILQTFWNVYLPWNIQTVRDAHDQIGRIG